MNKITFEVNNKEYELPTYFTIENYIKMYMVKDSLGDRYFQAKILNSLTGIKMETILKSNQGIINYLIEHITSMLPSGYEQLIQRFNFKGVDYGFIPSWKNMSFAEYVDLDTLLTKPEKEVIENLHIICAIMYRPITKERSEFDFDIEEYDVKTMEQRAELFKKELDIKYVLSGQFFFSIFVNNYYHFIPQSLIQKSKNIWNVTVLSWRMRKMIWKYLLKKDLDGTQLLIEYHRMILQNTIKSLKRRSFLHLINSHILSKKRNILSIFKRKR